MNVDSYVEHLRADAARMAAAYDLGPSDAAVAACPGWDVRQLVEHMAFIHRWADFAVCNARGPETGEIAARPDDIALSDWLRTGATTLADHLAAADPHADTWHVFPVERKMWVWSRRQALETAVHRWDAETATLGASTLDAGLARAGVNEYLELGLPRVLLREGVSAPVSRLGIECTDTDSDIDGGWTVWSDGEYRMLAGRHDAAGVLSGTAESVLLVLMGRADPSAINISGEQAVAEAWLSLPGW